MLGPIMRTLHFEEPNWSRATLSVVNLLAPVYELFSQMCENPAPVARLSGGGLYTLTQASR